MLNCENIFIMWCICNSCVKNMFMTNLISKQFIVNVRKWNDLNDYIREVLLLFCARYDARKPVLSIHYYEFNFSRRLLNNEKSQTLTAKSIGGYD